MQSINSKGYGMAYLEACANAALSDLERRFRKRTLTYDQENGLQAKSARADLLHLLSELSSAALESYLSQNTCREVFNLRSNDSLAFGRMRVLQGAASELAKWVPVGSCSSRLLEGDHPIFALLEQKCNALSGYRASLYVNSGFTANEILPQVLAFPEVAFFSDSANHASLIDGIRLAKIPRERRFVFSHLNYSQLENLLQLSDAKCNVIFCESLYSMDGDFSDLKQLAALAQSYRGVLVVDEAHSMGLHGLNGMGCLVGNEIEKELLIAVQTCGKALATQGAFISGPGWLREWIINRGRAFIYTTAASPLIAALTFIALSVASSLEDARVHLARLSGDFRKQLREKGYLLEHSRSHIIPIKMDNDEHALKAGAQLSEQGISVGVIRPPTVPESESRLRMSLHAGLTQAHLEKVICALPALNR